MATRHVLLMTGEQATVSAVSQALQSNGKLAPRDVCASLNELAGRLQGDGAPAAVVDIDAQPAQVLAGLESLARKFSGTRFIVLSGVMNNDLLLSAMQAGARHFMLKHSVASDLSGVLTRLCSQTEGGRQGRVFSVLSAGGGCGTTTIAVNLATELQLLGDDNASDPALLVDLDPWYGAVAAYFDVDAEFGVFDLLGRAGPIDPQLIQSAAVALSEKTHVLVSTPRQQHDEPPPPDPDRLLEVIDACKSAYRWTVIDAPRLPIPVAAEIARHCAGTVLPLQLMIKDIRVARRILRGLLERGVPPDSIYVAINRYRKRRLAITPDEARRALGLADAERLHLLSNDFRKVATAANVGKQLAQAVPRSKFRSDLRELARRILRPRTEAALLHA